MRIHAHTFYDDQLETMKMAPALKIIGGKLVRVLGGQVEHCFAAEPLVTTAENHPRPKARMFAGFKVMVENPAGSIRSGVDKGGHKWAVKMLNDYGYLSRTTGADGEGVDCFLGPDETAPNVYVVHQNDPATGRYDEDKCLIGWRTDEEAKPAYLANYDRPDFFRSMTMIPIETFRDMLAGKIKAGFKLKTEAASGAMFAADQVGQQFAGYDPAQARGDHGRWVQREFVKAADGGIEFGSIPESIVKPMGWPTGRVRLQVGKAATEQGGHDGFGKLHIERDHPELFRHGIHTAEQLVSMVMQNHPEFYEHRGRVLAVAGRGERKMLVLELRRESDGFWTVITGRMAPAGKSISGLSLGDGRPGRRGQSDSFAADDAHLAANSNRDGGATGFGPSEGPQVNSMSPSSPSVNAKSFWSHFAADESRWVTIGAQPGADGKKHGGTPVQISPTGVIDKGPAAMVGKKPSELSIKAVSPAKTKLTDLVAKMKGKPSPADEAVKNGPEQDARRAELTQKRSGRSAAAAGEDAMAPIAQLDYQGLQDLAARAGVEHVHPKTGTAYGYGSLLQELQDAEQRTPGRISSHLEEKPDKEGGQMPQPPAAQPQQATPAAKPTMADLQAKMRPRGKADRTAAADAIANQADREFEQRQAGKLTKGPAAYEVQRQDGKVEGFAMKREAQAYAKGEGGTGVVEKQAKVAPDPTAGIKAIAASHGEKKEAGPLYQQPGSNAAPGDLDTGILDQKPAGELPDHKAAYEKLAKLYSNNDKVDKQSMRQIESMPWPDGVLEKRLGVNRDQIAELEKAGVVTKNEDGRTYKINRPAGYLAAGAKPAAPPADDAGVAGDSVGEFKLSKLRESIKDWYKTNGGGAEREADYQQKLSHFGEQSAFLFRDTVPEEVRSQIEHGDQKLSRLFGVAKPGQSPMGEDAMSEMGRDEYMDMARYMVGSDQRNAIEAARQADDPLVRFHADLLASTQQAKQARAKLPPKEAMDASQIPSWYEFELNGEKCRVVEDENGDRMLTDGGAFQDVPVDALGKVPMDKGTLKETPLSEEAAAATGGDDPFGDLPPAEQQETPNATTENQTPTARTAPEAQGEHGTAGGDAVGSDAGNANGVQPDTVDQGGKPVEGEPADAVNGADLLKSKELPNVVQDLPRADVPVQGQAPEATARPAPSASDVAGGAAAGEPADKVGEKVARFERGKALTPEQKRQVLENVSDVYRDSKLEKSEIKGHHRDSGDPIYGYPHRPDLFHRSGVTGSGLRHYVTLPDGTKAHPSELYPNVTQSDVERAIAERDIREQNEQADRQAKDSRAVASAPNEHELPAEQSARNEANRKYNRTGRPTEGSYFAQHEDGRVARVDGSDPADVAHYKERGFSRAATPAPVAAPSPTVEPPAKADAPATQPEARGEGETTHPLRQRMQSAIDEEEKMQREGGKPNEFSPYRSPSRRTDETKAMSDADVNAKESEFRALLDKHKQELEPMRETVRKAKKGWQQHPLDAGIAKRSNDQGKEQDGYMPYVEEHQHRQSRTQIEADILADKDVLDWQLAKHPDLIDKHADRIQASRQQAEEQQAASTQERHDKFDAAKAANDADAKGKGLVRGARFPSVALFGKDYSNVVITGAAKNGEVELSATRGGKRYNISANPQGVRIPEEAAKPQPDPNEPLPPLLAPTTPAPQTIDPAKQLGLFAKDAQGNPIEVGEKPGQANLFGKSAYVKPETEHVPAKASRPDLLDPEERKAANRLDETATPSMFPAKEAAAKAETLADFNKKLDDERAKNPGKPVFTKNDQGQYTAYGKDAEAIAAATGFGTGTMHVGEDYTSVITLTEKQLKQYMDGPATKDRPDAESVGHARSMGFFPPKSIPSAPTADPNALRNTDPVMAKMEAKWKESERNTAKMFDDSLTPEQRAAKEAAAPSHTFKFNEASFNRKAFDHGFNGGDDDYRITGAKTSNNNDAYLLGKYAKEHGIITGEVRKSTGDSWVMGDKKYVVDHGEVKEKSTPKPATPLDAIRAKIRENLDKGLSPAAGKPEFEKPDTDPTPPAPKPAMTLADVKSKIKENLASSPLTTPDNVSTVGASPTKERKMEKLSFAERDVLPHGSVVYGSSGGKVFRGVVDTESDNAKSWGRRINWPAGAPTSAMDVYGDEESASLSASTFARSESMRYAAAGKHSPSASGWSLTSSHPGEAPAGEPTPTPVALPALHGSTKQVNWARGIRNKRTAEILQAVEAVKDPARRNLYAIAAKRLLEQPDAKWWIDRQTQNVTALMPGYSSPYDRNSAPVALSVEGAAAGQLRHATESKTALLDKAWKLAETVDEKDHLEHYVEGALDGKAQIKELRKFIADHAKGGAK